MIKPKVAVIMTAYNEKEEWIRKSIESILNQTYANLKVYILLDNPNNDKLIQLISEYAKKDNRITFLINEKNIGLVKSLNKLLDIVDEEYVARMDADDICLPNRIEEEMQFLMENKLNFVMSSIDFLISDNTEPGPHIPLLLTKELKEALKYGNVATHPTWLLETKVYKQLKGYREITYCEDLDFVLRALQQGIQIGRLNKILLHYRIRESGISQSYAYEQYHKANDLREAYTKGLELDKINPQELNQKYTNVSVEEKNRFLESKGKVDVFANLLYKGKYLQCMKRMIVDLLMDKEYANIFYSTFLNKMRIDKVYKSVKYSRDN